MALLGDKEQSRQNITIRPVKFPQDTETARCLLKAYTDSLPADLAPALAHQQHDQELEDIEQIWAPTDKQAFLIAFKNTTKEPIGCVALRPLKIEHDIGHPGTFDQALPHKSIVMTTEGKQNICEMKRLYTAPDARGLGLGRNLVKAIIEEGVRMGYEEMRLDTTEDMVAAVQLYESVGFARCEKFNNTPIHNILYFRRNLRTKFSG